MELTLLIVAIFSVPLHAFVAEKIFTWYLAPIVGVNPDTIFFVGLGIFVSLFSKTEVRGKEDDDILRKRVVYLIANPLWLLFCGWLIIRLFGS